jgi:tetratricopeptide (TPR) repeat protein
MTTDDIEKLSAKVESLRRPPAEEGFDREPYLRGALFDLGYALGEAQRYDEQLAVWEELVPLCREKVDPTWGRRDLGFALSGLGATLIDLGRDAEAVAPFREAVSIARQMVADDPAEAPTLARWLSWLSDSLGATGRSHEALAAAEEAVTIGRGLAADDAANGRALAAYLADFSGLLEKVGRLDEALVAQQEAVTALSRLSQVDPALHLSKLANALRTLVRRQRAVDRGEQAAATALECVTICRELVSSGYAGGANMLADALEQRMAQLSRLKRYHEALDVAREWLDLARGLTAGASTEDRTARQSLGEALHWVASLCQLLGRHSEVLTAGGEAINHFRAIFPLLDRYGRYIFASTLLDYAHALAAHRRAIDAVRAAWDAVAILRQLSHESPQEHLDSLRFGLIFLADHAAAAGNHPLATSSRYEAQAIERTLPNRA